MEGEKKYKYVCVVQEGKVCFSLDDHTEVLSKRRKALNMIVSDNTDWY